MKPYIDLRSDTVTQPTPAMREAMKDALVGDDVFQDDPSIIALEQLAAKLLGKEAALFFPTGTMANQVSIMTHTTPGDEIIAAQQSHIVHHEIGAAPRFSGVGYALVTREDTTVRAEDIRRLARPKNDFFSPETTLVCLENALSNGAVVPLSIMQEAYAAAFELGIPVHLDGARIFNAAIALSVEAKQIAACADSVMFCISKGLCAPVGSLLCGSHTFVEKARKNRKIMGGGMRQAGVLATCGLIAMQDVLPTLIHDHENAAYLGKLLADIPGIQVQTDKIQINMVFWKTTIPSFSSHNYVAFMMQNNVKILGESSGEYRFVTNRDVQKNDIDKVVQLTKKYIASIQ